MWVFDGENWFEEGGDSESRVSSQTPKPEMSILREEFRPELQVMEVVVNVTTTDYAPWFPLP